MKCIASLLLALCLCAVLMLPAVAEIPEILQPFLDYSSVFDIYNPENADGEPYSGGDVAGIVTKLSNSSFVVKAPDMGEGSYIIGRFCLVVRDVHSDDYTSVPGMMLTIVSPTAWNFEVVTLIAGDEVYSFYVGHTSQVIVQGGMKMQMVQIVFDENSSAFLDAMDAYFRSAHSLDEANTLPLDVLLFGDQNFYVTLAEDTMLDYNILVMIGHETLLGGADHMPAAESGNPVVKGYPFLKTTAETVEAE